ncbi:hypothetical protein GUJ93_ZPchr0010g10420 [Zizania palustris]|uniref:Uncharacterized protein n=1 Tax=Zizania palustris TaxID=103762 RepID=A0A8J6BIQ4_ZIZPA|nr:hypothetical protein GUJ93_ZPchr0010g10420 [Zizania palustris]
MGALRRRRQPDQSSSSSSSGSREDREDEPGGGSSKKQGRRKGQRREAVARAIRDRLPAAASCWGNGSVSVVSQSIGGERGRRSRTESTDDEGVEEDGQAAAAAARAPSVAWCCVCPGEDCKLEANPSANGKEDPKLRSLLESNDFYSADCNPHAVSSNPGDRPD